MGRKSRLKKDMKALQAEILRLGLNKSGVQISESNFSVYRFFKEESHADALCRGDVWISTLNECRKYEDPLQGDPEEAVHTYTSGFISGNGSDKDVVTTASRLGIFIGEGATNITIGGGIHVSTIHDAFVLCTTREFSPKKLSNTFGNYCVEILSPREFFCEVTASLREIVQLKQSRMGAVIYRNREYSRLEAPPGPLGFVKPHDKYAPQKEIRFLWEYEGEEEIAPLLIKCPNVARYCKRIV